MKEISKIPKPVGILLMLSLLIACHNDTDPGVLDEGDVNIGGDQKTSCKNNSEDGTSTIDSFKFSEDRFTYQEHLYSDNSCSQFIEKKTRVGKITSYNTGPQATQSKKKEVYKKDLLFDDGEEWKSLVALEDDDTTLYLAPSFDGAARPDDIISGKDDVYTLKKGTVPPPPVDHVDIDGTWKTECLYSEDDKLGYLFKFEVSEDHFSFQADQYSDSSCANSKDSGTRSGKVRYGEVLTTPSGRTAYELDLLFDNGDIAESLVARQGASRPDDLTGGLEFSKDSGPVNHVDIDGKWLTNCAESKKGGGFTFLFSVSNEHFSLKLTKYSDNSCTQLEEKIPNKGEITYGKELITPSGLTAHEIDLQFDNGSTWESLVAKQGNRLVLNPDVKGTGRPDDVNRGITFSKQ